MTKLFVLISALILSFSLAWAHDETPAPTGTAVPLIREVQERVRDEVRQLRQNFLEDADLRNATRQEIEKRKEDFRVLAEQKREEFRVRVEEARERVKQEIERKREEFKQRLQQILDEQKQKIAERIDRQLNELNQRLLNHFSEVLEKLEKVLINIISRTDKAEANGWDVSAVRTMITAAEEAIDAARTAIEEQAARNYTPEITGEEDRLRVEVGQARQALHSDIVAVRNLVRSAYEAVRRVATTLAQIPRVDELEAPGETPETSPSPSPTASPSPTP